MINFRFDLSMDMENLSKSIDWLINWVIIGLEDLFHLTLAQFFMILVALLVEDYLLLLPVAVICCHWGYCRLWRVHLNSGCLKVGCICGNLMNLGSRSL